MRWHLNPGWKAIRAVNSDDAKLRTIVSVVLDKLTDMGKLSSSRSHIFKNEFYAFLRKTISEGLARPEDLLAIVVQNPDLALDIKHKKFDRFLASVRAIAQTEASQEILFVTLLYDNYYKYCDPAVAIFKTINNPFSKFSSTFVYNTFEKYPYLKLQEHLDSVAKLLDTVSFAYVLTQHGIKEHYSVE